MKLYIITVVYNRQIDEIRSISEFYILMNKYPDAGLIVTDNSTDESVLEQNRAAASRSGRIQYLESGGNIGLSRAYNLALASIPKDEPFWVMLSDDDTRFSMEYLENGYRRIRRELNSVPGCDAKQHRRVTEFASGNYKSTYKTEFWEEEQIREPLRMMCGVVQTEHGWISPRLEHTKEFAFSWMLRRPKPGIYRDLYPINSGWFLEGSAIREAGGFDERLFLDQVDFLMMDRLRARGIRKIGVLPGEIRQAFSGEIHRSFSGGIHRLFSGKTRKPYSGETGEPYSGETRQALEERWVIFRKDFKVYCNLTNKPWWYRVYLLGRRRLMLEVRKILCR